jgi:hypothetical protein
MPYVCSFNVDGRTNSVSLDAKFIRSDWFNQSAGVDKFEGRAEQPPFRTFGGATPDLTIAQKLRASATGPSDNLNVNLVKQGGRLLAISDYQGYMEVDDGNLDTIGPYNYKDEFAPTAAIDQKMFTCAHPSTIAARPSKSMNFIGEIMANADGVMQQQFREVYPTQTLLVMVGLASLTGYRVKQGPWNWPMFGVVTTVLLAGAVSWTVIWVPWIFEAMTGAVDGVAMHR